MSPYSLKKIELFAIKTFIGGLSSQILVSAPLSPGWLCHTTNPNKSLKQSQ